MHSRDSCAFRDPYVPQRKQLLWGGGGGGWGDRVGDLGFKVPGLGLSFGLGSLSPKLETRRRKAKDLNGVYTGTSPLQKWACQTPL